jgi:hypothetical protein
MTAESDTPAFTFALNLNADVSLSAIMETVSPPAGVWAHPTTVETRKHRRHATWNALGFTNIPEDHTINGISVITDFKGLGRSRAVYELLLSEDNPSTARRNAM